MVVEETDAFGCEIVDIWGRDLGAITAYVREALGGALDGLKSPFVDFDCTCQVIREDEQEVGPFCRRYNCVFHGRKF